jgi:hypothetical protein
MHARQHEATEGHVLVILDSGFPFNTYLNLSLADSLEISRKIN